MIREFFLWACYRLWLVIPPRFVFTRFGNWLLQYAGEYACRPTDDQYRAECRKVRG